jgi:hypothetical protein
VFVNLLFEVYFFWRVMFELSLFCYVGTLRRWQIEGKTKLMSYKTSSLLAGYRRVLMVDVSL